MRESVELIADPRNLDASVEEVFQTMMGGQCLRAGEEAAAYEPESVTAVVGFWRALQRRLRISLRFRHGAVAGRADDGMEFPELDDTVRDAFGEICNMLAGAWKARVPTLAGHCGLSVPAVITGRDYNIHVQSPEFRVHHFFTFEGAPFDVTIICDGLR